MVMSREKANRENDVIQYGVTGTQTSSTKVKPWRVPPGRQRVWLSLLSVQKTGEKPFTSKHEESDREKGS